MLYYITFFQKCLDEFFFWVFFQFAIIFSGKIRLDRFYAGVNASVVDVIHHFFVVYVS